MRYETEQFKPFQGLNDRRRTQVKFFGKVPVRDLLPGYQFPRVDHPPDAVIRDLAAVFLVLAILFAFLLYHSCTLFVFCKTIVMVHLLN